MIFNGARAAQGVVHPSRLRDDNVLSRKHCVISADPQLTQFSFPLVQVFHASLQMADIVTRWGTA